MEWAAPSPPGHGNFGHGKWEDMPVCYRGPYEYNHPDREEDFWPQWEPPEGHSDEDPAEGGTS